MPREKYFSGVGITGEYAHSSNLDDGGCYLSYRGGVFHILSSYFSADAGYRFKKKSANGKLGVGFLFIFLGLETGYSVAYNTDNENNNVDYDDDVDLPANLITVQTTEYDQVNKDSYAKRAEEIKLKVTSQNDPSVTQTVTYVVKINQFSQPILGEVNTQDSF